MDVAILRAFLDDCKANPEDDARRLIFSDWLQEHGETEADRARAEFVRLQVRGSRLPPYDPAERLLAAETKQLESQHRAAWLGPLHQATFLRGLVRLSISPANLPASSEGDPWIEAVRVDLSNQELAPAEFWQHPLLTSLGNLHVIALRDPLPLFTLPHFHRLVALTLETGTLEGDDLATMVAWPGLATVQSLALRQMRLTDSTVSALLASSGLSALWRLDLSHNHLTATSLVALLRCRRLANLVALHLSFNPLGGWPDPRFHEPTFGPNLRHLTLHRCQLGDAGLRRLTHLDWPSLRSLGLSSNGLSPAAGRWLAEAPWLPQLDTLHLSDNPLRGSLQSLLVAPLPRLRALRLANTGLDLTALEVLTRSPNWPRLVELSLSNNPLGRAGAEAIRLSHGKSALRHLDVSLTELGDEGAISLAAWPGLSRLRRLSAGENDLGDAGLRALIDSPHLFRTTLLELGINRPSPGLIQRVRESGRPVWL